jgi:hypothetical protein
LRLLSTRRRIPARDDAIKRHAVLSRVGIKSLTIQSGGSGDLTAFRAIRAILADRFIRL